MEIGLFDGCFPNQQSATLAEDNISILPKWIVWKRNEVLPVTFFTDTNLERAAEVPNNIYKVAWLIEPPSISTTHYAKAKGMIGVFDLILTFNIDWAKELDPKKVKYYPFGGSWIRLSSHGLHDKRSPCLVSCITTNKQGAYGHILRQRCAEIVYRYAGNVFGGDYKGTIYMSLKRKIEALSTYPFHVVVESCICNGYFSEKLIDCFTVGTVPIYCGCPNIEQYFDPYGMIIFQNVAQLEDVLGNLSEHDYLERLSHIETNLALSKQYLCAEDWIFTNYKGELLNGLQRFQQ